MVTKFVVILSCFQPLGGNPFDLVNNTGNGGCVNHLVSEFGVYSEVLISRLICKPVKVLSHILLNTTVIATAVQNCRVCFCRTSPAYVATLPDAGTVYDKHVKNCRCFFIYICCTTHSNMRFVLTDCMRVFKY